MDEFGARVQHSADAPSVRMVPFISAIDGAAYSLLFPVKDVQEGEEITRDHSCCNTEKCLISSSGKLF